jgi:hypothetical protein
MLFDPTLAVVNLRSQAKGTARAFLDIEVTTLGIVLRDCIWRRHDGREWIGLPARRGDGVADFIPSASSARRRFQQAALKAVHAVMALDEEPSR